MVVAPASVHIDALPKSVTLAPHEQREMFLHLRGTLPAGRHEFGIVGRSEKAGKFLEGFVSLAHAHIPPVNYYHSSALYLQAVDIEVPVRLWTPVGLILVGTSPPRAWTSSARSRRL